MSRILDLQKTMLLTDELADPKSTCSMRACGCSTNSEFACTNGPSTMCIEYVAV